MQFVVFLEILYSKLQKSLDVDILFGVLVLCFWTVHDRLSYPEGVKCQF